MIDQAKASQLARAGFDLWQEGRREEAVPLYREALEYVDPHHWGLEGYRGEFAAILGELGRDDEALEQYELSLAAARRNDGDEQSPGVLIARTFLAEQLLRMDRPNEAQRRHGNAPRSTLRSSSERRPANTR